MTKCVKPPLRDRGRDDYVEGFDIEYEVGGMRVNGVKWVYHIYEPDSEPTQEYGIIGDIAKFGDSFWFHDARRWREVDEDVDETGRPCQKHPLLKGRYRFDCNKLKWRNSSSYRAAYLMKIGRTKESELKREYQSPQPAVLRRIKGEPIHIDLSRDDSWTLRENHNGDEQKDRQTILIDLTLEENAPPRRIAFLLPPSHSARLAHRAPSPGPSRSATPPNEEPPVASPPPSEDSMYTDPRPVVFDPIPAAAPEPTLRADVEVQTEYTPRVDRSTSVPRTDLQPNAQETHSNQKVITPRPSSEPASSAVNTDQLDNHIPTGWESVSTNMETVFGPLVLSDITSAVTQQDIEEMPNTRNDLPSADISDPNPASRQPSLDLGTQIENRTEAANELEPDLGPWMVENDSGSCLDNRLKGYMTGKSGFVWGQLNDNLENFDSARNEEQYQSDVDETPSSNYAMTGHPWFASLLSDQPDDPVDSDPDATMVDRPSVPDHHLTPHSHPQSPNFETVAHSDADENPNLVNAKEKHSSTPESFLGRFEAHFERLFTQSRRDREEMVEMIRMQSEKLETRLNALEEQAKPARKEISELKVPSEPGPGQPLAEPESMHGFPLAPSHSPSPSPRCPTPKLHSIQDANYGYDSNPLAHLLSDNFNEPGSASRSHLKRKAGVADGDSDPASVHKKFRVRGSD